MPATRAFSKYRVIEEFLNKKVVYPDLQIHLLGRRLTVAECLDEYARCVELLLRQHAWLEEATIPGVFKDFPLDRWLAKKGKLREPLKIKKRATPAKLRSWESASAVAVAS